MHYYFAVVVTIMHIFPFSQSDLFSPLYLTLPCLLPFHPFPLSLPHSLLLPPAFLWRLISHSIISQSPCRHKLTDGTTLIDYPLDSNELSHQA